MDLLTDSTIDVSGLVATVSGAGLGGTATFIGTVRSGAEDGPVSAIEYTAYPEMVEQEGRRILAEAAQRWPGTRAVFQHRLGRVETGAASVAVAAAAPHRAEAFLACRYVIEAIKQRLPVWKKELYADGGAAWRANDGSREPARSA